MVRGEIGKGGGWERSGRREGEEGEKGVIGSREG